LAAPRARWPFSSTEAQYRSFINRDSPYCTGYVTALLLQHLLRFLWYSLHEFGVSHGSTQRWHRQRNHEYKARRWRISRNTFPDGITPILGGVIFGRIKRIGPQHELRHHLPGAGQFVHATLVMESLTGCWITSFATVGLRIILVETEHEKLVQPGDRVVDVVCVGE